MDQYDDMDHFSKLNLADIGNELTDLLDADDIDVPEQCVILSSDSLNPDVHLKLTKESTAILISTLKQTLKSGKSFYDLDRLQDLILKRTIDIDIEVQPDGQLVFTERKKAIDKKEPEEMAKNEFSEETKDIRNEVRSIVKDEFNRELGSFQKQMDQKIDSNNQQLQDRLDSNNKIVDQKLDNHINSVSQKLDDHITLLNEKLDNNSKSIESKLNHSIELMDKNVHAIKEGFEDYKNDVVNPAMSRLDSAMIAIALFFAAILFAVLFKS